MIKFLLYLFESGICLSILLLVYIFFFRKETYFNFNRLYLLGIMFFALLIPILHVNIKVNSFEGLEESINSIGKFRTYYEQIIALTDPDYELYETHQLAGVYFENDEFTDTYQPEGLISQHTQVSEKHERNAAFFVWKSYSLAEIILFVYLLGVGFFLIRLFFLFVWLFKTIRRNPVLDKNGFKIVQLQGDIAPFSFFRYVFVNQDAVTQADLQKILAHEKVHIRQNHSADLLIAHGISLFQWFNPLAWLLQKAIKTTHEYIADRNVVDQGYELIDYQSLLLSQLISIRSVELVNNFNLISIKKRIAMMTKNKSGFGSKLKVLIIIPFAIILFFIFANMTMEGSGVILANYYDSEILMENTQLDGLWKSKHIDSEEEYILFKGDKLSILEKGNKLREYQYKFKDNKLFIRAGNSNAIPLKYKKTGGELSIWWNEFEYTLFVKTTYSNTLQEQLASSKIKVSLPGISQFRILEKQELCIDLYLKGNKVLISNKETNSLDLRKLLRNKKATFRALDIPYVTVKLFIDGNTSMKEVYQLHQTLRNEALFKIAYMGLTEENQVPLLLMHAAGLPQKLPPLDAKLLDEKELGKSFNITQWDLSNPKSSSASIKTDLSKFISKSDKYFMILSYDNSTRFDNYISHLNEIYQTIHELRNKLAFKKYNLEFNDLSSIQQKQIRKKYPITLTQRNLDEK